MNHSSENKTNFLKLAVRVALFSLATYYIFIVITNNFDQFKNFSFPHWSIFFTYTITNILIYLIISLFLAFSWLALNQFQHPKQLFLIYLRSIALKYLPGNILHVVYRHSKSRSIGISHKQLLEAALLETIGQVLMALIVATLLFNYPESINKFTKFIPNQLMVLFYTISITILFAVLIYKTQFKQLLLVSVLYIGYYLGLGLICVFSLKALGIDSIPYFQLTAIFAIAWLAGYLTPGAPGGVGVREAVFILLGTPMLAEYQAIILISYIRLLSLFTEVFIYFAATKITNHFYQTLNQIDKTTQ